MEERSIQSRYTDLETRREPFLRRARECAAVTIPTECPPSGHNGTSKLPQPHQGLGARCVTNLVSRLLTALLPAGQTFFIFEPPTEALVMNGELDVDPEVEKNLALAENIVVDETERRNWRRPTSSTLYQLVIAGNGLEYLAPDNTIQSFPFDSFVVVRDVKGNVIEVIVKQDIYPESAALAEEEHKGDHHTVEFYTQAKREGNVWITRQESDGKPFGKETLTDSNPFLVYRWCSVPCEDYGRGKIEEHYADFKSLEGYSKAMLDMAAMNARNLVLVRPNATGNALRKFVAKADNGEVGVGHAEDIQLVRFENIPGANIIANEIGRLTGEISAAFLLQSGLMRDAERVTAEEIRKVAEELEGVLGGVFSMLSEDMQKERLVRLISNMVSQGRLPPITDFVETQITVGLEALRREREASRVLQVLQVLPNLPQDALDYVPWDDLLKTFFIGVGLPGRLKSKEEVEEIRQKRMMEQAISQLGPEQLGAMTGGIPEQPTAGTPPQ